MNVDLTSVAGRLFVLAVLVLLMSGCAVTSPPATGPVYISRIERMPSVVKRSPMTVKSRPPVQPRTQKQKDEVLQSSPSDTLAERYHPDPEWEDSKFCRDPDASDYLLALQQGKGNTREREIYLRLRIWWFANDPLRRVRNDSVEPELPVDARSNVYALFKLLKDTDVSERLLKAEAARELGQFELAVELLSSPFGQRDLDADALVITELARQKKIKVRAFPPRGASHA